VRDHGKAANQDLRARIPARKQWTGDVAGGTSESLPHNIFTSLFGDLQKLIHLQYFLIINIPTGTLGIYSGKNS